MIVHKPPMGWSSWNTFGCNINEEIILGNADMLIKTGLADLGYRYVNMDDGWQCKYRDEKGRLVVDKEKFPHGMNYVADYLHERGLKMGMYTDGGTMTCAGSPGSLNYEWIDAESFAGWEADLVKYDFCYRSHNLLAIDHYRRFGLALENTGRDIVFSACSWGNDDTHLWIKSTGASMWRSTGDIVDNWNSIKEVYEKQPALQPYNGLGCFNDMDMMVVGMRNRGNVGLGGCTDTEYRTHFSLWALLNSPLIIGCDLREIDDEALAILSNKDIIDINQDPDGRQPFTFPTWHDGYLSDRPGYVKALSNGDFAIGMFNFGDYKQFFRGNFEEMGLAPTSGRTLKLKNLWTGEEFTSPNKVLAVDIEPHDCLMLRATVVKE